MKTRFFIIILLALPFLLPAQSQSIAKFFDTHRDNEDYTLIEISGNLFNLVKKKENKKSNIKIEGFQLLSAPKGSKGLSASDVKGFANTIKRESFEELMVIRDKDSHVDFMVQEKNGIIHELVMISDDEENFTILSLRGNIPTSEIEKLQNEVDIDGLEYLKN